MYFRMYKRENKQRKREFISTVSQFHTFYRCIYNLRFISLFLSVIIIFPIFSFSIFYLRKSKGIFFVEQLHMIVNRTHCTFLFRLYKQLREFEHDQSFFSFFFLFSFLLTNDRPWIPITINPYTTTDQFITEIHCFFLTTKVWTKQQSLRSTITTKPLFFFKHGSRHIFLVHRHFVQAIVMSWSLLQPNCLFFAIENYSIHILKNLEER